MAVSGEPFLIDSGQPVSGEEPARAQDRRAGLSVAGRTVRARAVSPQLCAVARDAIISAQEHPDWLADKAKGTLRGKRPQLRPALRGKVTDHIG